MNHLGKRLTYANVMSSIAVFLVLAGGTAFAASQLGKNSVGTKQLKKNAVTTAKIKKNAVTGAKIKAGAVNGAKIADGSITGTEIAAGSTPFSQIVARLRNAGPISLESNGSNLIGTYTQPVGETDQWVPGATVTFASTCAAPRAGFGYLIYNPADPNNPTEEEVIGYGSAIDRTGASATAQMTFSYYGPAGGKFASMAPSSALTHSFYFYPDEVDCDSGSGGSVGNLGVDVIGTK